MRDREHHLRLVVEVAAERVRAGCRTPTAAAECAARRRRPPRPGRARCASRPSGGRAPSTPAARPSVDEHAGHERLVVEVEVRVRAGRVAEHDVGARPDQAAIGAPVDGQRHPLHSRRRLAVVVDDGGEALAHDGAERRAVERVGRHAEQAVGLVEQLVEVGRGTRCARCPPGRGHAAVQCADMPPTFVDIAATGRPSSPANGVAVVEEERAGPGPALAALHRAGRADRVGARARTLRGALRAPRAARDPRCS